MRYKLTIEYLGTNYSGWQRQKNAVSVQEVLETVLSEFFGAPIALVGSGRTDGGVHAAGQVAHFDAERYFEPYKITAAINGRLPSDIKIRLTEIVPEDFHARFSAIRKTYVYRFYIDRIPSPTRAATRARIVPPVDPESMKRAAQALIGTHDFAGFSSTGSHVRDTVRTIYSARLKENGGELDFEITGSGFLYNMVRIIAGTLVFIGKGKLPPDAIETVFATKDRKKAGKTFPPEGLTLMSVEYPAAEAAQNVPHGDSDASPRND